MFENTPTATIHLDHIRENLNLVTQRFGASKVMAVVKANAYGHGVNEVASALDQAAGFAVARTAEAVELRKTQPNKPIVVLEGYLGIEERNACVAQQLIPMLHNKGQLELLPKNLPFWLKFNTGMFRLGFAPSRAKALATQLTDYALIGIASHFANADDVDHDLNANQIKQFGEIKHYFPHAETCLANSGGILNLPIDQPDLNWVRPGVMLYGGSPNGTASPQLEPGMTLTAPVLAVNELQAGDRVGYGSTWRAAQDCRVVVIAIGYADGYPREMPEGTPILINGERRELVGRVSMDMCTVLLRTDDVVSIGDRVTLWGIGLSVDEIAQRLGTISYTLMTGLGPRVHRVFNPVSNNLAGTNHSSRPSS